MKIQGLAVIAIIIILPMSIILNSYTQNQIKTLSLQTQYDSKLQNATYDAVKAFQLNMSNSTTSDLSNSKMRDIEASINTFYNSLASNFSMTGYGEDVLKNYVPAVVYTLYDGYYIYSAYNNTLGDTFYKNGEGNSATYKDRDTIYGLKPYIYYSCRYKRTNGDDFVITYSLDSYITVQGMIKGSEVNKSGYLLSGVEKKEDGIYYKGVKIEEEDMSVNNGFEQYVYLPNASASKEGEKNIYIKDSNGTSNLVGAIKKYPCKKINGVKYYIDENNKVFSMINDEPIYQSDVSATKINNNAMEYYEKAWEFSDWINRNLSDLSSDEAIDANGKYYKDYENNKNPFLSGRIIFGELENSWNSTNKKCIEDAGSVFNAHRIEVIKNSIESNLMVAISNYNNVSTSSVNFAMPKLTDTDWEELTTNVSMITFLQGLSIGGKVYNGYSIVRNDITEDFVSENSIYICRANTNQYYKVTDPYILEGIDLSTSITTGIFNVDFERKTGQASIKIEKKDTNGNIVYDEKGNKVYEKLEKTIYYYPRSDMASYSSIINSNNTSNESTNIQEYLKGAGNQSETSSLYKLAQIYYTALGRERYGMYRVTNKLEEVQEYLIKNGY